MIEELRQTESHTVARYESDVSENGKLRTYLGSDAGAGSQRPVLERQTVHERPVGRHQRPPPKRLLFHAARRSATWKPRMKQRMRSTLRLTLAAFTLSGVWGSFIRLGALT